ncbi:hypothetical protein BDB01DRAFT_845768 [Pilobolus umbonatus]|nr:hypothetical protein BDB01DRAFT_845768 [Pilobolus umbonatus]
MDILNLGTYSMATTDNNSTEQLTSPPRIRNHQYDMFTKGLIIGKFEEGATLGAIAKDMNIPKSSVQYIVEKYKKTGYVDNAIRPGRPKKMEHTSKVPA